MDFGSSGSGCGLSKLSFGIKQGLLQRSMPPFTINHCKIRSRRCNSLSRDTYNPQNISKHRGGTAHEPKLLTRPISRYYCRFFNISRIPAKGCHQLYYNGLGTWKVGSEMLSAMRSHMSYNLHS